MRLNFVWVLGGEKLGYVVSIKVQVSILNCVFFSVVSIIKRSENNLW